MAILEEVVSRCTRIEEALRARGADGNGISELMDSISAQLPGDIKDRLRRIATVRNKFVHEYGYTFPGSDTALVAELDTIIHELTATEQIPKRDDRSTHRGSAMPDSSPWVRTITTASEPKMLMFKWPCTKEERLVFFRGSVPEVLPLGKHGVPLFSRISTIAYVRTAPVRIPIDSWRVVSKDQIPIDIVASVAMHVRHDDSSIGRVAVDGTRSAAIEPGLALDHVLRAVQSLVSKTEFSSLPDLSAIQSVIEKEIVNVPLPHIAFTFTGVTLTAVQSSDPRVREAQLERLNSGIRLDQLKDAHQIEQEAAINRRKQEQIDWADEQNRLEAKRLHDKKVANDRLELEEAARRHELARLKMELDAKTKAAEFARDAEIAKAEQAQTTKMLPLLIRAAMAEGQQQLLRKMVERTHGVSIGFPADDATDLKGLTTGLSEEVTPSSTPAEPTAKDEAQNGPREDE